MVIGGMDMTDKEALEYFYRQMENGNIKNDIMQLAYERAIESLEEKNKKRRINKVIVSLPCLENIVL